MISEDFKPMLASPVDWDTCTWPKAISRKLDGIRCIVMGGVAFSRKLKPIPNEFIQAKVGHLQGYDGELLVGDPTNPMVYRNSYSGIMSRTGEPDFKFYVFDRVDVDAPWKDRFVTLEESDAVVRVPHITVHDKQTAVDLSEQFIAEGYEGAMLRGPLSPYKHGRSTTKQGWLLKIKEWDSREMFVERQTERLHNTNEATRDALGYIERSSAKSGKVGLGTMGTLVGRDLETGTPMEVVTGFTDAERDWFWSRDVSGLIIRYRCMKYSGGYDRPRVAVYEGLRSELDL